MTQDESKLIGIDRIEMPHIFVAFVLKSFLTQSARAFLYFGGGVKEDQLFSFSRGGVCYSMG